MARMDGLSLGIGAAPWTLRAGEALDATALTDGVIAERLCTILTVG